MTSTLPKISIITVCFNCADFIEKTIKSVLAQNYPNIEYIIIDGNSTDNTVNVVKKYADKINYFCSEPDKGIYQAINKGIKKATGEWIGVLHADDFYCSSNSISNIFSREFTDLDLLVSPIWRGDNDVAAKYVLKEPFYDTKNGDNNFYQPGTFIHRSFYEKYGVYDERYKIISDTIFNIKYFPYARYLILPEPLIYMADNGISRKLTWLYFREIAIQELFYVKTDLFGRFKKIKYVIKLAAVVFKKVLIKLINKHMKLDYN